MLAVLTVATLLAFWWAQPENRLDLDESIFRVPDLGQISKVELQSEKETVGLQFDGGRWMVNGQYPADAGMIRVLFATLQQAVPKRPVADSQRDSVFSALERGGVKVSLFEGDALKRAFYAGGNPGKTQGFFADPNSREVYVMAIPGYRVYVSGILELNSDGWRDKLVFGFNWQNFKSLEAQFPGKATDGFTVAMAKGYFGVRELQQTDTARLNTFLDEVSLLTVEEYISEPGLADSLSKLTPKMEIIISDVANRNYRLRLFDPGKSREGFGLIQDSQPAVFSRRKIESLLKTRSFFNKK